MIRCGWVLTDLVGGGAQRVPLVLAPALRESELTVVLLKDRVEYTVPDDGPGVVALSNGEHSLTRAGAPILTRAIKAARQFDVVVAGLEWAPTFFGGLSAAIANRPLVATVHTDLRRFHEFEPVPLFWWSAMRYALRRSSAVVAVSEDVRKCVLELGIEDEKVQVIPNPVKPFDSRPRARNDRPQILTVSSLKTMKGIDVALAAAARIADLDFEWTIVGDGPERDRLRNEAKTLKVSDRVRFLGFQQDVEPFYLSADLYVLPSRTEAFSLSLVEAMGAGLPSVATRCARVIEEHLSGGAGELVANGDPEAMAAAIRSLLAAPERRRRMGETARNRVRGFDARLVARQYDELFGGVVAEYRSAHAGAWRR
jgi:glycosyltransferase involved in cell wall biosynthesis